MMSLGGLRARSGPSCCFYPPRETVVRRGIAPPMLSCNRLPHGGALVCPPVRCCLCARAPLCFRGTYSPPWCASISSACSPACDFLAVLLVNPASYSAWRFCAGLDPQMGATGDTSRFARGGSTRGRSCPRCCPDRCVPDVYVLKRTVSIKFQAASGLLLVPVLCRTVLGLLR